VCVNNIARPTCGQESPDTDCINAIKRDNVARRLTDKPRQTGLAFGATNGLGQGRSWDSDAGIRLDGSRKKHDDSPVVAIKCS
jgi:hypothetical protein